MAVHALPDALTEAIAGAVLRPGDADYEDARSVWNALIDRRPAAIVRCAGTADVVAAVTAARDQRLPLSVKAGGHNVAGTAVNDGGLVIDLSPMRGVHVDRATGVVRVAGGATWGDVDRETQVHGLAVPGGVVSTTGVAGLTLHGGIGHLRRKHGLSIDNLLSVDLVTADGRVLTAGPDQHQELFWAIRGAGSNFGVVTSFEFQAHPVGPEVAVAAVFYPREHARAVLAGWREAMAAAPDEVSSLAVCWSVPAREPFPPELHGAPGVLVAGVHCGPLAGGEPVVAPLRELAPPLIDLSGPWPWLGLQSGFDALFPHGERRYWKSRALPQLGDAAIDDVLGYADRRPTAATGITLWHHGGAMSRVGATDTAYAGRDHGFLVTAEANWTDGAQDDSAIAWARELWSALERHSSGGVYVNFPGLGEDPEALARAGYGVNYDRLARVKATYDPANLFRSNVNIRPHT